MISISSMINGINDNMNLFSFCLQHTSLSPDGKLLAVVGDNTEGILEDSQIGRVVMFCLSMLQITACIFLFNIALQNIMHYFILFWLLLHKLVYGFNILTYYTVQIVRKFHIVCLSFWGAPYIPVGQLHLVSISFKLKSNINVNLVLEMV